MTASCEPWDLWPGNETAERSVTAKQDGQQGNRHGTPRPSAAHATGAARAQVQTKAT